MSTSSFLSSLCKHRDPVEVLFEDFGESALVYVGVPLAVRHIDRDQDVPGVSAFVI